MEIFLIAATIFGRFLLIWRRESLSGYFGPPGSEPGIFMYALGNLLVGALGFIAFWGSVAVLVVSGDLYPAALALVLAFLAARPLFRWACGGGAATPRATRLEGPALSSQDDKAVRALVAALATPAAASISTRRTEPVRKYGLGGLCAGIPREAAIQIMLNACNKPDTMFITDRWVTPRLVQLRSGLANPITEDQAQALLDAVLQRCKFKDLLQWLEGEPIGWKEFQTKMRLAGDEAKRVRADRLRKNWDWEKTKRLQEAGVHVYIPPEVLFRDPKRNDSDPEK